MDADIIIQSLEMVGERGDPMSRVYKRLFEQFPETESLFFMGPSAKGHMLDEVLTVILDFMGPRAYAPHFMRSEIVNHENLGVPPDVFMAFFATVRDTFRDIAAEQWTPQMDAAWAELLSELQAVFGRASEPV